MLRVPSLVRRSLTLAVAVLAFTAIAAIAAPTQSVNFGAELLQQPGGTGPWAINLLVNSKTSEPDGSKPPALKNLFFRFPHATVNTKAFPTCTEQTLRSKGPNACPAKSLLGVGTAIADARPILENVDATLKMFNGPPVNGNPQFIIYAVTPKGLEITVILKGTLKKDSGKYGYSLDIAVPDIPTLPNQPNASIGAFSIKVGAKIKKGGKTIQLLHAPTSCPSGGFPFFAKVTYADGTNWQRNSAISCTITSKDLE